MEPQVNPSRPAVSAPPPPRTLPSGVSAAGAGLWSSFWQDFTEDNLPHERCYIPGDGRPVVDAHWARLADALPPGAAVIDLACGAGIVGSTLLKRRGDLNITGVDWADVPMPPVPNLSIHAGVSMEALPFADGAFDAAVSLFGIEYGQIDRIASELERVLKPGARFSFLVHHSDSEILREGGTRRRAVREVLSGKTKAAFLGGNPAAVELQLKRLLTQFPHEPTVKMFVDYFRRTVARPRAERDAMWAKLIADFDPEILLLGHLERSAKSPAGMGVWLASLLSGMAGVSVSVLRRRSGEPIAWAVAGIR